MKYQVTITYQDGGQIKAHTYEYETPSTFGANHEISIVYRDIQHKGGVDIPDGQAVERVAIGQIHKVRIEPIAETPAQDEKPAVKGKPKTRNQFSHTLGGGG